MLTAIEKIGIVTDIPLEDDTGSKISLKKNEGIAVNIKNLSYRFKDSNENTLNNIDFNVESGSSQAHSREIDRWRSHEAL